MPKLPFRPDADGFAFGNGFSFTPTEEISLTALASAASAAAVSALGLGLLGPVASSVAAGFAAIQLSNGYGLCGGLCYAALDYWRARTPLPRGTDKPGEPQAGTSGGGPVRDLLWRRLLDSLDSGGALSQTLEWMLRLHFLPGITGGARWLRTQTQQEWGRLKSHVDQGQPWPIGLIGRTLSIWDQHQVLVYGYDIAGGTITLLVYDPNDPHQQSDMSDTVLTVDFTAPTNAVISGPSLRSAIGQVVGFFCTNYGQQPANASLAIDFGLYVNQGGRIDKMAWGTRLPVVTTQELVTIGGNPSTVRTDPNPPAFPIDTSVPRDGAILQDRTQPTPMLYQGGAPFPLASPVILKAFGGASAVQLAPAGSLAPFKQPPLNNTLLRELSKPDVYLVLNGNKLHLTTQAVIDERGGTPSVRIVPDGSLADMPDGPSLPIAQPGECDEIRNQITALQADMAVQEARLAEVEDPDNPQAGASIKATIEREREAILRLQGLAGSLGCP